MKQKIHYLFMLLLMIIVGAGGVKADEVVTFTPGTDTGETSVQKKDVTVTMTTMDNASYYQIYANRSATFACSYGKITKIEFTCTASGTTKYGPGNCSTNVGTYTFSGKKGTWTGSAESVTISSTAQVRMSSLEITYEKSQNSVDPNVSFANESFEVVIGNSAVNTISKPSDLTVTYESSNPDVASVDATTGEVTGVAIGDATITAKWNAVEGKYNKGSKSYSVVVREPSPQELALLFESWSNSSADNDGTTELTVNSSNLDSNKWYDFTKVYQGGGQCGKLGTGSAIGKMITKEIALRGNGNLTFKIKKYGSDNGELKVSVTGAAIVGDSQFSPISTNQWTDCTINLVNGDGKVTIVLETTSKRMYIDDIMLLEVPTYTIDVVSNNVSYGSVVMENNVITATPAEDCRFATPAYTVTSGEAEVEQDGNTFIVTAKSDCQVQINFEAIPTHIVTFSVNGTETKKSFAEGSNITFDNPDDEFGKSFIGWTTDAIDATTDKRPELVTLGTMGSADVTYYAVFANVTAGTATSTEDILTREWTGVEETTTYAEWFDMEAPSKAIYAGQSAGDKNSIQLRSNNSNSGVISTTSGGRLKKVAVVWNDETIAGRTLNVYGSNTAYTDATDLYDESKQGSLLGTIVKGTSTELEINGDYTYVGLRSASGAMYLTSISITWENGTPDTYSDYCTTVVKPVAKIANKGYATLQEAVDAAEEGAMIDIVDDFTLTTVTTSPSDKYNVNVNKSVTINGNNHVITASEGKRGIVLEGEGLDVTIKDLTIKSNKAEACLWIASNLTCTLDNTVLDGTNGKSYNQPLTIGSIDAEGRVKLNVTNGSVIKTNDAGTAHYAIIAWHPADITVTGSKLIGWANVYLKSDAKGSTVKIENSEMKSQGLSGNSNNFATITTECNNSTIEVKDTKITSAAVDGTYMSLLTLGGEGNVVKLLGETTYETNSKEWGAITYNWGALFNNKLYLDDTTKEGLAEYFDGSHQETVDPADETGLYPVSFVPEVYYYWINNDGSKDGGYYNFYAPFEGPDPVLMDGEFIELMSNIKFTKDVTYIEEVSFGDPIFKGGTFTLTFGEYDIDLNGYKFPLPTGVTVLTDKQTDIFSAAEAGYKIVESTTEEGYSYTAQLSAPIIFHDEGTYEDALTVAMAGEGTIKYTLNDGAEQTYTGPFTIDATTTIKAWTELDGATSDVVTREYTINKTEKPDINLNGYYSIKNNGNDNGNGKYVNVAGRKTVTFVDEAATATAAGTVIKVETENAQVKVLRSQGIDVPGYAEKAMRYVPEIVKLVVNKLNNLGEGQLMGEAGLEALMKKFNDAFDEHLYLEQAGENSYRIYGRTPSMKHVVDFYAENKANVDAKLPMLEGKINAAIEKVLEKTKGRGAGVLVPFSLKTVWENMGKTLTEPVDEASTMKFYEEVLTSETNVWNFAYETAMIYWTKVEQLINNPDPDSEYADMLENLGDYKKYLEKVPNIRPNFKYFIVQKDNKLDIISEGNGELNADFTAWTLIPRTDFSVAFNEENVLNDKYYTTLYTDFAYTLPTGVKAYKVTSIDESGCFGHAATEEIGSQSIAAQTPVLLVSETSGNQTLALAETGTAVEGNWLVGPDYLINKYQIKTAQVESLFDLAKTILGEKFYKDYVEEYEHLMLRNAGTVNNKYFFGLSKDDCKNLDENVCMLDNTEEAGLAFANGWETMGVNKAFLTSDIYTEIRLAQVGDVNRSGYVSVADVNALVEIVLGKVTPETDTEKKYDFGATDVNCDGKTTIADVTALVNIILKKTQN